MYTLVPADHSKRATGSVESKFAPWTPEALEYHPYILVNYLYQEDDYVRDHCRPGTTIFADSGGFQLATRGMAVDPIKCMEWQNRNADVAFVVDRIPVRHPGPDSGVTLSFGDLAAQIAGLTDVDFLLKCARETASNANAMLAKKDSKVKLYGIIQGGNLEHKRLWAKTLLKDHEFDGMAMKGTSNLEVLQSLIVAAEFFPEKPIHFLGSGSFSRIAPLIYHAQFAKGWVTSDATSHLQGTKSRIWFDPVSHQKFRLVPKDTALEMPMDTHCEFPPCACVSCAYGTGQKIDYNSSMFGRVLTLHNHIMVQRLVRELAAVATAPVIFKDVIEALNTNRTQDDGDHPTQAVGLSLTGLVDAITDLHEEGPEYVVNKYITRGWQPLEALL